MFSGNEDSEDEDRDRRSKKPIHTKNLKEETKNVQLAHDHNLSPSSNAKNTAKKEIYNFKEADPSHLELELRVAHLFSRTRRTPPLTATSR